MWSVLIEAIRRFFARLVPPKPLPPHEVKPLPVNEVILNEHETHESVTAPAVLEEPPPMAKVVFIKGMERLSAADLRALDATARWIGVPTSDLAVCIGFETGGTFDPAKRNAAGSGATGLIQFMPDTARRLGTTTSALAKMSFIQQLEYVKKYFAPWRGKLKNLEDLYLAIFYPKEIGRRPDDVIAVQGSAVFTQNAGFANLTHGNNEEGLPYITRGDVTKTIVAKLNNALATGKYVNVPSMSTATAIALGAAGYGLYTMARSNMEKNA